MEMLRYQYFTTRRDGPPGVLTGEERLERLARFLEMDRFKIQSAWFKTT